MRANASAEKFLQTLEEIGVNGFESLADSLAQAIVNAEDLGDVAKNVFRQMIAELLAAEIKKIGATAITSIFKIPGFASGTNFAPGGAAIVGEHGPELVSLPRGAKVMPTPRTLAALHNMQVPKPIGVQVLQPVSFDLRGALTTPELMLEINRNIAQSSAKAAEAGRRLARSDIGQQQYSRSLNA